MRQKTAPNWGYVKYLLYWPAFLLMFWALERAWAPARWHVIHCALDDVIPFCEWFLLPYAFWYLFLAWAHVYTFFREPEEFRRLMCFIALTHTVALVIFMLYPSAQDMRPAVMPRDNLLTRLMRDVWYSLDTSTNTCPSLHVVDSAAAALCLGRCRRFSGRCWRLALCLTAALISASTLFVKQHSAVDVVCALLVCAGAYIPVYAPASVSGRRLLCPSGRA